MLKVSNINLIIKFMKTKPNQTKFKISNVMKRCFRNTWLFFLGIVFLVSCTKDTPTNNGIQNNLNEVPKTTIIEIAQNLFKNSGATNSRVANSNKTIKDVIEHQTQKNQTAFYVINYNEGGFAVIAADNRISPILAYSETGNFSSTPSEIIAPIKDWIEVEKEHIQNVIEKNLSQDKHIALEWTKITAIMAIPKSNAKIAPDPTTCNDTHYVKGPLMTTHWDQWGNGYNDQITLVCPYNPGGKAPTGCVATAMAQVMRYFQKANTYNWTNMPDNYGTSDTALLMKNAGAAVNMQYSCGVSGAYPNDIAPALRNSFGYTNAIYSTFNYNTVFNEIEVNRPVILGGNPDAYNTGHCWVCHGYSIDTYFEKDVYGNCTGFATQCYYLYMNWGWSGSCDGYYNVQNFNPPGYPTFNYNRTMVYNIIP
jgi:hypothetical protein